MDFDEFYSEFFSEIEGLYDFLSERGAEIGGETLRFLAIRFLKLIELAKELNESKLGYIVFGDNLNMERL